MGNRFARMRDRMTHRVMGRADVGRREVWDVWFLDVSCGAE